MGTFLHLLWDCSHGSPLRKQVIKCIREWLHKPLPESPWLCLLGDRSVLPPGISKKKKKKKGLHWQALLVLQRLFYTIGRIK